MCFCHHKGAGIKNCPFCHTFTHGLHQDIMSQEMKHFIVQNNLKHGRTSVPLDSTIILITKQKKNKIINTPKCLNHPQLSTTPKRLRAETTKAEFPMESILDVDSLWSQGTRCPWIHKNLCTSAYQCLRYSSKFSHPTVRSQVKIMNTTEKGNTLHPHHL